MISKFSRIFAFVFPVILGCSYPFTQSKRLICEDYPAPQESVSCWRIVNTSLPLLKSAYKNGNYDALLTFFDSWKFHCSDQSIFSNIRLLVGVKTNQKAEILLDSFFIEGLRYDIGRYIDKEFIDDNIKWIPRNTDTSLSEWLHGSFSSIADTINRNSVYYPLSLYLCGKKDSSFIVLEKDSANIYSPFSNLYKKIKSSLIGIKIIVPDNYPTIQEAVGHAKERDTIFIRNGNYKTGCIIDKRLTITGEDRNKTIIRGKFRKACFLVKASDSSFLGMVEPSFSNITFMNCTWGIIWANTLGEIRNCVFYSNGIGVISYISLPTIRNSIFVKNKIAGIFLESSRATRHLITNNVFVQNGTGIRCLWRTEVPIRNNIFYNNFRTVIVEPKAKKTQFTHNDVNGSTIKFDSSLFKSADSNISVIPVFVAPGPPLFDYSLRNSSEFKGKGFNQEDIGIKKEER